MKNISVIKKVDETPRGNVYNVRSYSVSPNQRGSPKLQILTDKLIAVFEDKNLIRSFLNCAFDGNPMKVRIVEKETPTGGKYETFERIEEEERK